MADAAQKLMRQCDELARASEPVQESVARLVHEFANASPVQRMDLYERSLFLQYGLLLRAVGDNTEILEELHVQPAAGGIPTLRTVVSSAG